MNLPYEFHDFVQGDKDQYFYDYAVVAVGEGRKGEDGKEEPPTLDLLAAATRKETIAAYRRMLRLAGMKLVRAVPECQAGAAPGGVPRGVRRGGSGSSVRPSAHLSKRRV